MSIVSKASAALQYLFGPLAERIAKPIGLIVRKRKFTALSLARTFVLGFLQHPNASDEQLARLAAQAGADVTPQAIDQRHTPKLVTFLKELFLQATGQVVGAVQSLAPLLERFTSVRILDSSTVALPDGQQQAFPGCGGSAGTGPAAMKVQVEWDLRSGALTAVDVEPGRSADVKAAALQRTMPKGSLRITDLGYFCTAVFAAVVAGGSHFLSRLQFGTKVLWPSGEIMTDVLSWLGQQAAPYVDAEVLVGQKAQLPCRLIAWRLPAEQANRRRQKLREQSRKHGREPSAACLAWCDWTILITSVPATMMSCEEAVVLYRARWQIELLFKRWKSQDKVAVLSGSSEVRQMVGVWSRLLAALVQHWLVLSSAWGDPRKSLSKVCEAVRDFVGRLVDALDCGEELERTLEDLRRTVSKTCPRNQRSQAGTFELLNDVSLLDFC